MATGSIFSRTQRDGSTVWRVRVWVGGKRRSFGSFAERADAELALRTILADHADDPGARTLGSWGEEWLDLRETDGKHRSVDNDRSRWARHVAGSKLADVPLRRLASGDVVRWLDGMERKTAEGPPGTKGTPRRLSRQTRVHALHLVQKCLADAVKRGHLAAHPALEIDAGEPEDVEWDYLRANEIASILALPEAPVDRERRTTRERWLSPFERTVATVAVYTGLRPGELWGLQRNDVDLDGRRIKVQRSRTGPTKTKRHRVVPILEPVGLALRAWFRERPSVGAALVFPGPTGGPFAAGYDMGWSRILRMAGVTRPVLFRQLRHTFASHLVMGTWTARPLSLYEVAELCGHSDPRTTKRYAHLCPGGLAELFVTKPEHVKRRR